MSAKVRPLVVLAVALLAPVAIVVTRLSWSSMTPSRLPTHWSASGRVNGLTDSSAMYLWCLILSLALAAGLAAVAFLRRPPEAGRLLMAMLTGATWMAGSIYVLCMALSRNKPDPTVVHLPWWALVLSVGVPLVVGGVVWFALPADRRSVESSLPSTKLRLGPQERVTWFSSAHSIPMRLMSLILAIVGATLLFFAPFPAVILLVVAVALGATSEVSVRIDEAGLHTLWGPAGWPRQVIHLDGIVEAHAQEIKPTQWGGWGYRISSRGTAAVVRTGPGIVVQRRNGNNYAVTVDDAAQGADVLNALLIRAAPS